MPRIPEPQPLGDTVTGTLIRVDETDLLLTDAASVPADAETLHSGTLVVRYGVRYLGKPHLSIVPGLLATDQGEVMTGEVAWDFLLNRSNLHPRADVHGYRNDGEEDMVFVKELDVMRPIEILAYADDEATEPLGKPQIVMTDAPDALPDKLRKHATLHASLADWRNNHDDEQS